MNILRNILAIIAGIVVGGLVNLGIVMLGYKLIPLPPGVDTSTMEGLKAAMPLFEAKHFIMPFAAHAIGTLVGALIAALIAVSHKMKFALAVGVWFILGGIAACLMIPAPTWFVALDLIVAYFPMAWLGGKLGSGGDKPADSGEELAPNEVENG
jgi:hypothetical protein